MESIGSNLSSNFMINQLNQMPGQVIKADQDAEKTSDKPGDLIGNFGQMLKSQMDELNTLNNQAGDAVKTYAVGGPIELHNVMLAMEKSSTAMQLSMQIRNKILSGYQELMRMNI